MTIFIFRRILWFLARWLPVVTLLVSLSVGLPAGVARGEPQLVVRDLLLPRNPQLVRVVEWEGQPAVMVLLPVAGEESELQLLRFSEGRLTVTSSWSIPRGVRWVEPIGLGKGKTAWLVLLGADWFAARPEGKRLTWSLLCHCQTLFSAGRGFLPLSTGFAEDLDRDGVSEVLLPHWRGMVAYRLLPAVPSLQPIWRVAWNIQEKYANPNGSMSITLAVPRHLLRDIDGDGIRDFVLIGNKELWTAHHPSPGSTPKGPFFSVDPEKVGQFGQLGLTPSVLSGLRKMAPATYGSPGSFLSAFNAGFPTPPVIPPREMARVLEVAREEIPVLYPRRMSLAIGATGKNGERARILTVEDMNGDGAPDVIHVKSTDTGDIFDQKNQVRWFRGSLQDGNLAFDPKPKVFFSEGPAFAELVYPRANGAGEPALFLATVEVTILAVIRLFTVGTASLDLYVYPWRNGEPVVPPPNQGTFTFQFKSGKRRNRPMVLLADLDGDGWREYLFNMELTRLTALRAGPEGPNFGDGAMVRAEVPLPLRRENVFVRDLDGNHREELVLWYTHHELPAQLRRTLRVLEYVPAP